MNIFVELESLANSAHRSDYKRDRAVYDSMASDDEPLDDAIELLEALNQNYTVIIFTTRNQLHEYATTEWLMENDIPCDDLLMRPENDYTPAIELKKSLILDYYKGRDDRMEEETFAIISNHEATVESFREDGFFVIQTGWGE